LSTDFAGELLSFYTTTRRHVPEDSYWLLKFIQSDVLKCAGVLISVCAVASRVSGYVVRFVEHKRSVSTAVVWLVSQ
jgi:hypothetical protein